MGSFAQASPTLDVITTPPTDMGSHGRAWAIDLDAVLRARDLDPADFDCVAAWLVEAPRAHPVWHSYWISVANLRPREDEAPLKIYLEGATHELLVYAMDMNFSRQQAIETGEMHLLTPCNFAAQLIEPTDAAAVARVQRAVTAICEGRLSPDSDYSRVWAGMFGDNMVRKSAAGHAGATSTTIWFGKLAER